MTIIAYRDGVMASDTQISQGGGVSGFAKKMVKTKSGILVGCSGDYAVASMFMDYMMDDSEDKPEVQELKLENFECILVHPDQTVAILDSNGWPMAIKAPWYVCGSGAEVAKGALEMGATAQEAVKAAIKWDNGCGGRINVIKL